MNKIVSLWPAFPLTLALAATFGCQGINASQEGQDRPRVIRPTNGKFPSAGVDGKLLTSPNSLGFGHVQVGTSASLTETLKNASAENLTVLAASVYGAGFSITGLTVPLLLGPNQSITFGVHFSPEAAGSSDGALSLKISDSRGAVEAALSGEGVSSGGLVASRPSITFSNLPVGTAQTQAETVRNDGGSSATISYVTVAGSVFSVDGLE